ncbi:MAG: N-acetylmuramoyl-L-alanine amidase [Candidatus Omnitrophota bacterium]
MRSEKWEVKIICSLLFAFCFLLFAGCATVSYKKLPTSLRQSDYLSIDEFCKQYGLRYSFDTTDDIIRISSQSAQGRLLLNSLLGYFNGSIFYLKKPPLYFQGRLLLPKELGKIILSKKIGLFKPSFTIKTIVIDPGHGGKDPGAISRYGLKEKDLNLKVSKYLKEELEKRGFKVVLTRSQDTYLSLESRVGVAKKYSADLFISIHANSNRSRKVRGVEVYCLSSSRVNSHERGADLAKKESFWPKKLSSDAKAILWDLTLTSNYALSVEFAHSLYFTFKNLGFRVKLPLKASFYVLKFAYAPSVLVEMGYLSNQYEEKALRKTRYQKQIAESIALGVVSLGKRYAGANQ